MGKGPGRRSLLAPIGLWSASVCLATFLIISSGLAAPGSQPVYIWISGEFNHHLMFDYSLAASQAVLEIWDQTGIKGQFFSDGLWAEALQNSIIEGWGRWDLNYTDNIRLGYLGEASHGPYPVIADYYSTSAKECGTVTLGLQYDQAYQRVQERYSHHIDPLSGHSDYSRYGGAVLLGDLFGKEITSVRSCSIEAAFAGLGIRSLPTVDPDAVEFGHNQGYFARYAKEDIFSFFAMLTGSSGLFWYMDLLHFYPDAKHSCIGVIEALDRDVGHLVNHRVIDHNIYLNIDPWDWSYNNHQWGCRPPDINYTHLEHPFVKTKRDMLQYIEGYRSSLVDLINNFLAGNRNCRLVTAKDLYTIVKDTRNQVISQDQVVRIAAYLSLQASYMNPAYGYGTYRPPSYVDIGKQRYFSLAEAFWLLGESLRYYTQYNHLPAEVLCKPLLGPIETGYPGLPSSHCETFSGSALLSTVRDIFNENLTIVPGVIECATATLNPAEFLYLMAQQYMYIYFLGISHSVACMPIYACPVGQPILYALFEPSEPYPLFDSVLQLWTLKPAVLIRTQRSNAPPMILSAGYDDTYLDQNGGLFRMVARAWDYDGYADINQVMLYYQGQKTGLYLRDDGTNGDATEDDGIFTLEIRIKEPIEKGTHLLQLVAVDNSGASSDPWPYLRIYPDISYLYLADPPQSTFPEAVDELPQVDAPHPDAPVITQAGFSTSLINSKTGGDLFIKAHVRDPQGAGNIRQVQLYYLGLPTGIYLSDGGGFGDEYPNDGIWSIKLKVEPGLEPDYHLFSLIAVDYDEHSSIPWPYLAIY